MDLEGLVTDHGPVVEFMRRYEGGGFRGFRV